MTGWTFLCEKAGDVSVNVPTCFWVQSQLDPHPGTLDLWQLKEGPERFESANILREWRGKKKRKNDSRSLFGLLVLWLLCQSLLRPPLEPLGVGVPGHPTAQVISKLQSALMFNDPEDVMRARTLPALPSIKVSRGKCFFDFKYESGIRNHQKGYLKRQKKRLRSAFGVNLTTEWRFDLGSSHAMGKYRLPWNAATFVSVPEGNESPFRELIHGRLAAGHQRSQESGPGHAQWTLRWSPAALALPRPRNRCPSDWELLRA